MSDARTIPPEVYIRPQWRRKQHIYGDRCTTLYRDDRLGVQFEEWCFRRHGDGPMGFEYYGGGEAYFIDGDPREFATEIDMIRALAEKRAAKGATP